jgi:trk system potassium uptake protein TrkA
MREVNVRAKHQVNIIACKQADGHADFSPGADWAFDASEHLMMVGRQKDVEKLLKKM